MYHKYIKNIIITVAMILAFNVETVHAQSSKRLIWNNEPLTVLLKPGEEIRVIFPSDVNIQVPVPLLDKLNTLQVNPRVVYWKALESFPSSQVIAISDESEEVYLLNIKTDPNASIAPITIDDPAWIARKTPKPVNQITPANKSEARKDPREILITKHVAKLLYAPTRLLPTSSKITRVPSGKLPLAHRLKRSQRGETYNYEVLGQWKGYGIYLTAVKLENTAPITIDLLDLRTIRGNFTHIASQHPSLGPTGTSNSITTLYLISLRPFQDAIEGTNYGY